MTTPVQDLARDLERTIEIKDSSGTAQELLDTLRRSFDAHEQKVLDKVYCTFMDRQMRGMGVVSCAELAIKLGLFIKRNPKPTKGEDK